MLAFIIILTVTAYGFIKLRSYDRWLLSEAKSMERAAAVTHHRLLQTKCPTERTELITVISRLRTAARRCRNATILC